MIHEVEISPEVVRLAQFRTRTMGAALSDELARNVVQEAVYASDPEAGLVVEEDRAYSSEDALVAGFGVNDVVINGCRVDVRTVDEDGRVSVSRALVGSNYMTAGTLAVRMNGNLNGTVIGFIPASEWEAIDRGAGDQQVLFVKPKADASFDMVATLNALNSKPAAAAAAPQLFEVATFVANRAELSIDKQRKIVNGTLSNQKIWSDVARVVNTWSKGKVRRILTDASAWNRTVERMTDVLAPKFKRVSREDIKKIVAKLGETFGGQPEAPAFRKAVLSTLTREELAHSLGGAALKKASDVADAVLSGRAVTDAIKDVSKNPVAVQIATQIKKQRQSLSNFVDATAQELAGAFQQMALQPAYATHSADPASGVESINEALKMLDAAELAETLKALDEELANI